MLREVGQVKWYGGLNSKTGHVNDYGFISHITHPDDLYFHKRDIKCNTELINENSIVSFDIKSIIDKSGRKKLQAIDVNIIEKEEDIEAITTCALSNRTFYWFPVFIKYLKIIIANNSQSINDLIALCIKKNSLLAYQTDSFLESLPIELYIYSQKLRQSLTSKAYLRKCAQIIEEYEEKSLIKEVHEYLRQESYINSNTIWEDLPLTFLNFPDICELAPNKFKAEYIISLLDNDNFSNSLLKDIADILKNSSKEESDYILSILPSNLTSEPVIFPFLNPTVQVDIIWEDFKSEPVSIWEKLSNKAKVFSLYRAIQENLELTNVITKAKYQNAKSQDDAIVSFVLKVCLYPQISFIEIHNDLMRLIVEVDGDISRLFPLIIGEDSCCMILGDLLSDSMNDIMGIL